MQDRLALRVHKQGVHAYQLLVIYFRLRARYRPHTDTHRRKDGLENRRSPRGVGWRTAVIPRGAGERPGGRRADDRRETGGRPAGHGGPKPRSTGRAGKGHCHPVPRSLRSPLSLRLCARGACAVRLLRCPRGGGCPGRSAAPLPVHPCLVPRRPPPSQSLALPLSPSGPPLSQSDSKQN